MKKIIERLAGKRGAVGNRGMSPIIFLFVPLTLLAMGGLGYSWWQGTLRGPVELNYCTKGINYGAPQVKCTEYKTLRIPWIYYRTYPTGIQHPVTKKMYEKIQELIRMPLAQNLEVAYPSMQPWNSLPPWQRWNTQKIEIDFEGGGLASEPDVEKVREEIKKYLSGLGTLKLSHVPGSLYSLDQYLEEPWHGFQYLWSFEPNLRTSIRCGYSAKSELADEQKLGCTVTTYTPWGLPLSVGYKRILLPQWADIHAKTQALIQSFVVTP